MKYNIKNLEIAAKFEQNKKWNELLEFSEKWVIDEPRNFFAWQAKGDALRNLGMLEEAISVFRIGLDVIPLESFDFMGKPTTSARLWYRLGNTYRELGDVQLSIEALKEAARIDPMVADIWNDLGIAYLNSNDHQNHHKAFKAFKKSVSIEPENQNSLKNLGIVYAGFGVEDGVNTVYQMLSTLNPSFAKEFLIEANKRLSKR